jgi:AcrR family transcriptional regulator
MPDVTSPTSEAPRAGRPRSATAHRANLDAARELIDGGGFAELRLEHVAARAGVGKATIYRHWSSKQALALDVLLELATPFLEVRDVGNTRQELLAAVNNAIRGLTTSDFGPVMRALLSQIAIDPALGDPFRDTVVKARRDEIARVIERGVYRGNLRPDADVGIATEMLVGPVYFRLAFGGTLDGHFANRIVDTVLDGFAAGSDEPT